MEEDAVNMVENSKIHLKWAYAPVDFFEEKETDLLPGYEHTIENGEVTVVMDLNEYKSSPNLQEQLNGLLVGIFGGASLVTQKPYILKPAGQEIINPDGRRNIIMEPLTMTIKMDINPVDFIIKNSAGDIVADTKQERLIKQRELATLSAKYRGGDAVLDSVLLSFEKSLQNPKTELVHLYEIRDALSKKFGGEKATESILGISDTKWSALGRLANHEPLNQGRHSGEHVGGLRDATKDELDEARSIAIEMAVAYLEYLERITSKSP